MSMSYPPQGPQMGQSYRQNGGRRHGDFQHYSLAQPPQPFHYNPYPAAAHYAGHLQMQQYAPQWYQPYQQYQPMNARAYGSPLPVIPASSAHVQPFVPAQRTHMQPPQTLETTVPELLTPSTTSQVATSASNTPTASSISASTPPVHTPKPAYASPSQDESNSSPWDLTQQQRMPFYPEKPKRRRTAVPAQRGKVVFPSRDSPDVSAQAAGTVLGQESLQSLKESLPLVVGQNDAELPTIGDMTAIASKSPQHNTPQRLAKPVLPAMPIKPVLKSEKASDSQSPDTVSTTEREQDDVTPVASPSLASGKSTARSWAQLFNSESQLNDTTLQSLAAGSVPGSAPLKADHVGHVIEAYRVGDSFKRAFLEPRGLVNTGNMCYMNAVLVFCAPFYRLLEDIGQRAAHRFVSDTPLLEAMILFMREFTVIDSAESAEKLRMRLKDAELEQYGDPLTPEYVYEVINRLPRFSSMRRGHQQDAEEFLGFLLEGLHDECVHVIRQAQVVSHIAPESSSVTRPQSGKANIDEGWLEVGPKQKPSVTRSSGNLNIDTPIAKIFGGQLRSVLKVPGLKDSITLEPYQPLQLDIGSSHVYNILDAIKGLTRPETLHGEFNSPRGPRTSATKQVFIETLPPVLILHLKRFQYDNTGGTQKIWRKVGYPLDLEIPKEALPQYQRAGISIGSSALPKYRLISVVYHHGKSASGGHYTVDVRRQDGREWVRLDDTFIRRIRTADVAAEGAEEEPRHQSKAANQQKTESPESPKPNFYENGLVDSDERGGETEDGWNQVNELSLDKSNPHTRPAAGPGVVQTPSAHATKVSHDTGSKDNKVAYILFYEKVGS